MQEKVEVDLDGKSVSYEAGWLAKQANGSVVVNVDGTPLGRVSHLMKTGANDVLVVQGERERLIPFIEGQVVLDVDVGGGRITVDWDAEF